MAWFWTDDLARRLVAEGLATEGEVSTWVQRPCGVAIPDDDDVLTAASALLSPDSGSEAVA